MRKVLIVWDVKRRGTPATRFYRALFGYDYNTKRGTVHAPGVLDEIPDDCWEFVCRSALLIEKRYARLVEEVFREFEEFLKWMRFEVTGR